MSNVRISSWFLAYLQKSLVSWDVQGPRMDVWLCIIRQVQITQCLFKPNSLKVSPISTGQARVQITSKAIQISGICFLIAFIRVRISDRGNLDGSNLLTFCPQWTSQRKGFWFVSGIKYDRGCSCKMFNNFMFGKSKHENRIQRQRTTITIIHDYVCRFFLISDEILHGRQWSKSSHLLLHRNTSQNHFNRRRRKIYKTFKASWLLKLFTRRGSGKSRNWQSWLHVTDSALIILKIPGIHDITY